MKRGVVAIQVSVGTRSAIICRRCANDEDSAVKIAIHKELVPNPSVSNPPVTGEVLAEHPEARGSCDACGAQVATAA